MTKRKRHLPNRSSRLLLDFEGSFSAWTYNLIPAFRGSLDIYLTPVTLGGKTLNQWTQGIRFEFSEGEMLYHLDGSSIVQVQSSRPCGYDPQKTIPCWYPGVVSFKTYAVNQATGEITEDRDYVCSQTAFVALLRSGILPKPTKENGVKMNTPDLLKFQVQGSGIEPYDVVFERNRDKVTASCTCRAGQTGTHCKHRLRLMDGYPADVVSKNLHEVELVSALIKDSDLERAYLDYLSDESQIDELKKRFAADKKRLARIMDGK